MKSIENGNMSQSPLQIIQSDVSIFEHKCVILANKLSQGSHGTQMARCIVCVCV